MTTPASDDAALIAEIFERISDRFPAVHLDDVEQAVRDAQRHFARARVKDFVPVLIEREARARLERPINH